MSYKPSFKCCVNECLTSSKGELFNTPHVLKIGCVPTLDYLAHKSSLLIEDVSLNIREISNRHFLSVYLRLFIPAPSLTIKNVQPGNRYIIRANRLVIKMLLNKYVHFIWSQSTFFLFGAFDCPASCYLGDSRKQTYVCMVIRRESV